MFAISVDPPADTLPWVERRGLTMPMLSDPQQRVIADQFHLRNPQEPTLSIHAVYLLDGEGRVYYRKVGRRRPISPEFIAAIDWHKAQAQSRSPSSPSRPAP